MKLTTEAQLAEDFGIDAEKAAELRRTKKWPHVRLGRFDVRYTDDQIARIVELQTPTAKKSAKQASAPVTGQTARSAARSA